MSDDVLIVKVNMLLRNEDMDALRKCILKQRDTGLIVLPTYCEPILVPKDVEIEFEEKENEK